MPRYDMRFAPATGRRGPRYGRDFGQTYGREYGPGGGYGDGFRRGYDARGGFGPSGRRAGPPPPPPEAYGVSRWRRPPWRRGRYDAPLHGWLPAWWDDAAEGGRR